MELAIIGCGASGLSTAKIATQLGLKPTVFERAHSAGGLWRSEDGFVWKSLHTNVSKYSTSFSDFHWDSTSPLFPSAQLVQEYLHKYAIEHKLIPYIQFGSDVTHISHNSDNHHWEVTWKCNSQIHKKIFNYVVVCSGFLSSPYKPPLDHNGFKGQMIHSSEYRSPGQFKDKRVLVVGSAFSGADIAAEVAEVAKETYIAIRRPAYILPRLVSTTDYDHIPIDLLLSKHQINNDSSIPSEAEKWQNKHNLLKTLSSTLGLTIDTNSPPFIVISDKFVEVVEKRKIVLCKALQKFDGNKPIFEDDDKDIEVDAVIFATGYGVNLSFFDKDFLETIGYSPLDLLQPLLLHETIFPQKFPNIAFVGLYRGSYFLINELQARWACLVFSGKLKPPSETEIKQGIQHELEKRDQVKRPQYLVDYGGMADHLAKVVGVFPDELEFLSKPLIPAHYGLVDCFLFENEKKKKAMAVIDQVTELLERCKKNIF